ncbi:MAG TPA: urea ABC transporter permease subunit UrtB [Egibacteraceae bacterium]|nr:urea ABC transporter permease subunit UrtB [Egibacteraceae bacterium]
MSMIASQLVVGLSIAGVLALVAIGLSFTFGQMNVINFAHGEFVMAGAYVPYVLQRAGLSAGKSLLVGLPVAIVVAAALGLLLERTLVRRLYGRPLDTLLVTYGVSLVLQQAARDLFGAPNVQVLRPSWLDGRLTVGPVQLSYTRLAILVLISALVVGVTLLLTRTATGRRMRAVTQNRRLAASSGLPTRRTDAFTFALGSGLAGAAGVALALLGPIGPSLGTFYVVDAFLVVIVGGLGHLRGAVLAALAIGITNAFVELSLGTSLAKVIVFALVIAFLQLRPQGLVSSRTRALV